MLSDGSFFTTAIAFVIRSASFILLVVISGTLSILKAKMKSLKNEKEAEGNSISIKTVVFSIVWNYALVVLCVIFAKREPSIFFSAVYSIIAVVYLLKVSLVKLASN